jgi:hypothetical protein
MKHYHNENCQECIIPHDSFHQYILDCANYLLERSAPNIKMDSAVLLALTSMFMAGFEAGVHKDALADIMRETEEKKAKKIPHDPSSN